MHEMPKPKLSQRLIRQFASIRVQYILVPGFFLLMALAIAAAGYFSLRAVSASIQTDIEEAQQALSLDLSTESAYLLARQSESDFMSRWRSMGFEAAKDEFVAQNQGYLGEARAHLNDLKTLVQASGDPKLAELESDIDGVQPALDTYETAFADTLNAIDLLGRSEGVESNLNREINELAQVFAPLSRREYSELVFQIQASEQAYHLSGSQEFDGAVRLHVNNLITLVEESRDIDIAETGSTRSEIVAMIEGHRATFANLVRLNQIIAVNSQVLEDNTETITHFTGRIASASSEAINTAQSQLDLFITRSNWILLILAGLTAVLGIVIAVFSSRQIILPLNQLSQVAHLVGQGDLDQRATVSGGVEIVALAENLNAMTELMQNSLSDLEKSVAERTSTSAAVLSWADLRSRVEVRSATLRTAAEVARDITATRELDILLNRAINLILDRFNFYFVCIFLIDESGEYVVMQAGTGEAGQVLLENDYKLKVGESAIIGYVSSTGLPRISLHVDEDAVYLKNPLLPDTQSEVGLPLKVGDRIIGVLDVQSEKDDAFEEGDVTVLQTMADQLAVAIDSARVYQDAQTSLKELQSLYTHYSEEAWQRIGKTRGIAGFQFDSTGITPIDMTKESSLDVPSGSATAAIPLQVRGQVIGALDVWSQKGEWTPDEIAFLQSIGDRISQAMESARLFEEAQARALREQTLNQLVARFARSLDFDTLLNTAVQELGQLPDVTEVSIHIGPSETIAESGNGNGNKSN